MAKMFQVYGIGQALIPVLPPPVPFQNAPTSEQTNYEIGQVVYTPPKNPTSFYMYAGAGVWSLFSSATGDIISILGTANQIAVNTVAGVATISLPSAITAPGSLTTTTTLASGTTLTAGSSLAVTTTAVIGTGLTVTAGGAAITGTTTINTSGAGVTSIGTGGTGATNIGNATGNTAVTGSLTASTTLTATAGAITATNGNLVLGTAGNKLSIATGSNASCGVSSAMSGTPGAVTVSTTACTASSVILFSRATTGGTPGQVSITAQSTSGFTLTSTGNETSTFNWLIIN